MALFTFKSLPERLQARVQTFNAKRAGLAAIDTGITARKPIGIQVVKSQVFSLQQFEQEEPDMTSYLGTPIFDPLIINGGSFFELTDINQENAIPYPDEDGSDGFGLVLPTMVIDVSQSKNIIVTAMQGRNGTVKENVSDGDFAITLTGIIIGKNIDGKVIDIGNVYPEDDVNKLITICKVPEPIKLTSAFLNNVFGIDYVVVTDYNVPQKEATRDMQPFQITLLSDAPMQLNELEIEDIGELR